MIQGVSQPWRTWRSFHCLWVRAWRRLCQSSSSSRQTTLARLLLGKPGRDHVSLHVAIGALTCAIASNVKPSM